MRMLWKGVLAGAAIGAGVKVVQEIQGDGDIDQVGPAVAKAAGQAALVGAGLGLLVDRRRSKKQRKLAAKAKKVGISGALATAGALAEAARPAVEAAAEVARDRAARAAEAAKPHVKHAAEVARERATEAAVAARPHVEHAADLARARAAKAGEAAKAKLAELDLPVLVAV